MVPGCFNGYGIIERSRWHRMVYGVSSEVQWGVLDCCICVEWLGRLKL